MTRRRIARMVAVSAAVLVLGPLVTPASAHHRPGPCDFHRGADETVRKHMRDLIRCASERWETKGGPALAICIARRESGLQPTAGASGPFIGLFQHTRAYWRERYETWSWQGWDLKRTALNGRTNAIVTMRMVGNHGWGAWGGASC
jgi:hypothetical protein